MFQRAGILKEEHPQLPDQPAFVIVDGSLISTVNLIRSQINGLQLRIQHLSISRQAEVACIVQRKIAHARICNSAIRILNGEKAVSMDGKVQRHSRRFQRSLCIIGVNLAGGADIALSSNLLSGIVLVSHPAVHDIIKCTGGIPVLLISRCGDIHHIVGYDIQILLMCQHG